MLCLTAANWVWRFDKFRSFSWLADELFSFRWLVMENTALCFLGGAAPEPDTLPLQDFPFGSKEQSEVLIKNPFGCTRLFFWGSEIT